MGPQSYKHLGFTGTKENVTPAQYNSLVRSLNRLRDDGFLWMHNGDCVEADEKAAKLWKGMKGKIYLHPPTKGKYRANLKADIYCEPADYLVRDRHIAESCELLVACPLSMEEEVRSGTWTTVRYARTLRRCIILILPDGSVKREKL